jgi:golgi-specific brefeldin A-resistance guanine nucleotide exchange factor 1
MPHVQQPVSPHPLATDSANMEASFAESTLRLPIPPPPPIAVARDPVALVVQECITVTGAMRKHARWAHSSVSAILGGATVRPVGPSSGDGSKRLSISNLPPGAPGSKQDDKDREKLSVDLGDEEEAQASRWGLRGKKGKSMVDNPLLSAFARLRSELKGCSGKSLGLSRMRQC